MTMIRKIKLFVFTLLLLLTACQGDEAASSVPTSAAAESISVVSPNATSTVQSTVEQVVAGTDIIVEATASDLSRAADTPIATETATLEPTTPPPTVTPVPPTNVPVPTLGLPTASIELKPVVAEGLTRPVYLTHAFDDRLLVVEQAGTIRIIRQGELLDRPFLDIRDRVGSGALEQGLLSVAFHPQYTAEGHPAQGRFFVDYTNLAGDTVIARYQVSGSDPDQADPDSEVVLLTISQPYGNHNGGQLQFGPDGYLYVGMGDGGSRGDPQGNGQNPATLLGTLLRLNVDSQAGAPPYAVPTSNPFVSDASRRAEIWAIGLRNPWRFSFDRLNGDLYLADVGQNNWEEVDFQPAGSGGGENYGWNIMEGTHCYASANCDPAGLELPIFEYDHGQGCSITGGYVYRGQAYPELSGNYFVGDYCSGIIWSLFPEGTGGWIANQVLQSGLRISSFGQDSAGELYVLDHSGGVYQIQP